MFKSEDTPMGRKPQTLTKGDIHTAMRKRARELFPEAPTPEQAFVRFIRETAEGREARALLDSAPAAPLAVTKEDTRPLPPSARTPEYAELCAKAEALRKEQPHLTIEQARVLVRRAGR